MQSRYLFLPLLLLPLMATADPGLQKAVYQPAAPTAQRVNFNQLAQQCAGGVHHDTLQAIARVESGFNPYAIGVVKGALKRQPTSYAEAVATAKALHAQGRNFSMGLVQVNKKNLPRYGLTYETVFDPCKNLAAGARILTDCFTRAEGGRMTQSALQKAFSCYYSGNFRVGFTRDFAGQPSYVQKVVNSASANSPNTTLRVPAVDARAPITTPSRSAPARQTTQGKNPYLQPAVGVVTNTAAPAPSPSEPVKVKRIRPSWDVFAEF